MHDQPRAGRTSLRLVDPDQPGQPDPFAQPVLRPRTTGPVARPLPQPPANAGLDWPSQWWAEHECANRRRCPHVLPLPGWWLLMAKRGVPFHPDAEQSFQKALARIRTYQGSKPVFDEETRLLVQGIVIDALVVAPQPVTHGWVHTSLMTVGGLVRWAQTMGEPLERDHLLSQQTRNRFLNLGTSDLTDTSRRNYRCRLDLIATGLTSGPVAPTVTRPLQHGEAIDPHTATEVATLWVWAQGLRPATRRDRILGAMTLGLGCGLRAGELVHPTPESVSVDEDGVHVTVVSDRGIRVVTCDRVWEDRLVEVAANTPAGHPLTSPWRADAATARGLQNAMASAQHTHPPIAWFSARSLRNTWLVQRLTEGTPVPTLLEAAGLESIEALKAFLVYVPALSAAKRAQVLRGHGIPATPATATAAEGAVEGAVEGDDDDEGVW